MMRSFGSWADESYTLNFSKEVYAHSNTNVEGRTGYSAQFIECWLLDRKEEIKRGQSCKSAAVAFNGRVMEISYLQHLVLWIFWIPWKFHKCPYMPPPQTQMQSVHTCLPIVMLWNLLIPLLFYYTEFKRSICTPHAVTHKWKHITCNRKHIGSKQAVFFTFWESKQSISIIFLSALKLSRILKSQ